MSEVKQWLMRANDIDNLLKTIYTAKISRQERIEYMRELKVIRSEIFSVVRKMSDYASQCIIIEKYINNTSWEEIAEKLHYSEKYIRCDLHSKALREIGVILNARKRNNREKL